MARQLPKANLWSQGEKTGWPRSFLLGVYGVAWVFVSLLLAVLGYAIDLLILKDIAIASFLICWVWLLWVSFIRRSRD
jgi:hypothetical protein